MSGRSTTELHLAPIGAEEPSGISVPLMSFWLGMDKQHNYDGVIVSNNSRRAMAKHTSYLNITNIY